MSVRNYRLPAHARKTTQRKLLESKPKQGRFSKRLQTLARIFLCLTCFALPPVVAQAQALHEPARGTAERSQILDAVRPLMEARLGAPVEFVVSWLRSGSGWAFAGLAPQRPGGEPINLRDTVFAGQAEYMDGLQTYALLRFQNSRWNIIDFAIGPTDVFWQGDPLYGQLPLGLTPY